MTDTNERMSDEQIVKHLKHEAIATVNPVRLQVYGDAVVRITQLVTDLSAANERAEKAEAEIERRDSFYGCDGCSTGDCPHGSAQECSAAQAKIIQEQEAENAALREALPKWLPASDHPNIFEDGDAYLVCVPVVDNRFNREYMEYHIIVASGDSETPITFNDQHGDVWHEWGWEDVESYIKLDTIARITT